MDPEMMMLGSEASTLFEWIVRALLVGVVLGLAFVASLIWKD